MEKVYVGIDVGTSSIKMNAVNEDLVEIFSKSYVHNYVTLNDNWTEIDTSKWTLVILESLKEMLGNFSDKYRINSIGITGQMHTTAFVDSKGYFIRNAIMWNDKRTKNQAKQVSNILSSYSGFDVTKKIISTGSPLANILWLKENELDNYDKLYKVLIGKDCIVNELTGKYTTDYCDASTSAMFDFETNNWSTELLDIFHIPTSILPKINSSSNVAGNLTEEIKRFLKIDYDIPVVVGTGDNAASVLVTGSLNSYQPLISLGSSGVMIIPNNTKKLKSIGKNVLIKISENSDVLSFTQGTVQSGAKTNSWWLNNILMTKDFDAEENTINEAKLGLNDVLFFPHLDGEKTLYGNPNLRGAFIGLSLEITRYDMYQSVLEGISFGLRKLFEMTRNEEEPEYFLVVGGGCKSQVWLNILANVLGYPIRKVPADQEAVNGASLLAMMSDSDNKTLDYFDSEYIEYIPKFDLMERYNEKYKEYKKWEDILVKEMED